MAALLGPLVVGRAFTATSLLFAATLVSLYSMAHLYRSRLSMSVLDQLPALVGRWLAAIAITILLQAVLTQLRWEIDLVSGGWSTAPWRPSGCCCCCGPPPTASSEAFASDAGWRTARWCSVPAGSAPSWQTCCSTTRSTGCTRSASSTPTRWLGPRSFPLPLLGGTGRSVPRARRPRRAQRRRRLPADARDRPWSTSSAPATASTPRSSSFPGSSSCTTSAPTWRTSGGCPGAAAPRGPPQPWLAAQAACSTSRSPTVALLLVSPIMLLAALAVRLEGGPGIIFRQERVGVDGRRFQVMKFRSHEAGRRARVRDAAGTSRRTIGSARSAGSCARPRSTSCRSCSTSSGAR